MTSHPTESTQEGMSRRDLVQVLAAGAAAASVAAPAVAQSEAVIADATPADYVRGSWHWSFLAQPEPFPETLISAVPPEWYLKNRGGGGLGNLPKPVFDEFVRCYTPKTIKGTCHDYRANATIDFEMDRSDKDKRIPTPLLILWGTRGSPPTNEYPTVWRKYASNLVSAESFNSGHYLHWDVADDVYDRFMKFFTA